jgi:hypothetical protein
MYLSANEIAQSREHALNNFLGLSSVCFNASQRLAELLSLSSREAVEFGSKHLSTIDHCQMATATELRTAAWLENAARAGRRLEEALEILGETHKAMIRGAEAQVCVLDEMAFASLRRVTRTSPWEAELALNVMTVTLQGAEQTLHGMSAAAIETVDLAQQEARQTVESLAEAEPAPGRRQIECK